MAACPACGFVYEGSFRFCPDCAAPLTAAARVLGEERKVVTALFCDLVGFTAMSESADPEDVDQVLAAYFVMAQELIEGHGGLVEKFIGDAVVGVFGVPAAHEDDPERAVRAGLRIVEEAERLTAVGGAPLRLRVGINTGEALVRLGVSPGSGQSFLTGDAINTASRIQAIAPQMGVAVGLATYQATSVVFDYEEMEPAGLKGKAGPVRVFHPKTPRARFGTDITRTHDSPFVGREIDLALLKGIFDKAVAAQSVQLVTVVGEPGLGKTRIVAELFGYIDTRPGLVTWRQGRCLPYGEGITFWALGEIVKAHAGILESDPPGVATAKLDVVLPGGPERAWFRQRLLPLLGIEVFSTAAREELFTAWRRFLEYIAEERPTVLVFEDLHWADAAMLAFIEHLGDRAEGVPLLVVGTARPELFEHSPDYVARLRNVNTVNLAPLSEAETARLVSALLDTTVLPAELQRPILERAGGNPFYAEEFVRLLKDKDLLSAKGSSWELRDGAQVPFPDSVQSLIAARLDTLAPEAKSLLADAAVVGKVFWAGAVAAMGQRDRTVVVDTLRELSRKELVRPSRRSSIQGEAEYAFWHVLTRDVAYGQLPRGSRAGRHVAAAQWIESKALNRVEDLADVLAYHYATALELAQAAGQTDRVADLQPVALRFLTLAGERALGLDTTAALTNFERALAVTPAGHRERPEALARFGEATFQAGRFTEAAQALTEAITSFQTRGDLPAAAHAMATLTSVLHQLGDPRCWTLPADAVALLEPLPPGTELVAALTEQARAETLQGRLAPAIGYADQALALGDKLDLDRPARALGYRGLARASLGDPAGLADMREAIGLATTAGQGREVALLHNNLAKQVWGFDGPAAALDVMSAGIAFARSRGLTGSVDAITAGTLDLLIDAAQLDPALNLAGALAERFETNGDRWDLIVVRAAQTRILVLRGHATHVVEWLDWLQTTTREIRDTQMLVVGLAPSSEARAALGQTEAASTLLADIEVAPGAREVMHYGVYLPAMVRTALTLGHRNLAERIIAGVEPRHPYTERALATANAALAEAKGDLTSAAQAYADAAQRWEQFGVIPEHAFALLGQGRCQVRLGRVRDATTVLRQGRAIFEQLGAQPALAETDALLGESVAHSSAAQAGT